MRKHDKNIRNALVILGIIFIIAEVFFGYSSILEIFKTGYDSFVRWVSPMLKGTISRYEVYSKATHYYIFPENEYTNFLTRGLTPGMLLCVLVNAIFNFLFQPLFLCVFTPQTILTYLLFPFFMYGCAVYFKKVPLMIILFFGFGFYLGLRDSVVEGLIRHRMTCDSIYLLIGLAGFVRLITKKS